MKYTTSVICLLLAYTAVAQKPLTLPSESPYAIVTQRVGITDITVTYHSPGVKGRKIWGNLVPYGQVWRAGADDNTTVSFTHNVSIGGKPLAAGTYGLHMIPAEQKWTVILSKNHTSWGSFFYNESEDALRVEVTPKENTHTEWLTYVFTDKAAESVTLVLEWEKLSIPLKIEVDVKNIVYANIKNELRNQAAFTWQGWYSAASYCYRNGIHYDEAANWVETANQSNPGNFSVLKLKANLMRHNGDSAGAEKIETTALEVATENQLNSYGYELLFAGKTKEATEIFRLNVKRHPKSWNAHDSLAEVLEKNGETKEAVKEYETALKNTPPDNQKKRIENKVKTLNAN